MELKKKLLAANQLTNYLLLTDFNFEKISSNVFLIGNLKRFFIDNDKKTLCCFLNMKCKTKVKGDNRKAIFRRFTISKLYQKF